MNAVPQTVSQLVHSPCEVCHYCLALQQVSHDENVAAGVAFTLLTGSQEGTVSTAIRVVVSVIMPFFGISALSAPALPSSSCRPSSTVAAGFRDRVLISSDTSDTSAVVANNEAVAGEVAAEIDERDAKGSPDFYGNEVIDAVAEYKLDGTGSLYEVHSPQTELPSLASPTS
jgi:hypothetical protein